MVANPLYNLPMPAYRPNVGAAAGMVRPGATVAVNAPVFSPEISRALDILGQIRHLPGDEAYIRGMGVEVLFNNGAEALNLIRAKGIQVAFGDMGDSKAHAQWVKEQNLIMINQKYRGDMSPDTLYAISEAIYHEAGHASRLGDDQSSIQEEINCLALNTLAYRYHTATDPSYLLSASRSRLIQDGVALYAKLFFDPDPNKQALVNRVILKYGELPLETPDHGTAPLPYGIPLGYRVLRQIQTNNTRQWVA